MYSETPDIIAFDTKRRLEVLSAEQIKQVQAGTYRLLQEVGVHFPSPRALELFADHGADVDLATEIVRLSPDLVDKAMSTAPRSFVLGGREERFDMFLDGRSSYLCTDGCGVHVVDLETRERRPSRKADVAMMARVSDSLPLIGFFWPLVSAQDHGRTAPLHECHAGLTSTLKHVRGGTTTYAQLAPYIVEMATVVAGSEEVRRKRPPICANICTIAPLSQDQDGIECALIYAEAGIPTSFMAMTTMGSTAPATPLGALVTGDAEVVSAMVLMQLAYPGAPVFHSVLVSLMHPRFGSYVSDMSAPLGIMSTQLAHAWNVPALTGGSVSSDAAVIGWQSGTKTGFGSAMIPLAGSEICGYLGLLDGSMILQPEQLLLDHDACQHALDIFSEFEFDEADMALDVIKDVGPRSHFLKQRHTRRHIRDFRLSRLTGQKDDQGKPRDPRDVALEEFKRLDETHHPKPLSGEVLAELDRILEAAEREAEKIE
ncbi:MAG TPA: trimethylamine methyltransferase family protein [Anaerolineae bacterium]|jgi:trimethylamine--corrinoid protein Co-methyltransferase|nr:trimethylamine methyltransferase family protein [Anaerolineae bacterium]